MQRLLSSLCLLLIAQLIAIPASATPVYKIDLSRTSLLTPGTDAESDAYNADSSNQSAHPVFTEEADLDFGTRLVHVYLIASRHDGDIDVAYVESELRRLKIDPAHSTLFVEQDDPLAADGSTTVLTSLINAHAPTLKPALARATSNPRSILSPIFSAKLTFAQVARHWQSAGGQAFNMDLSQNFSVEALKFLSANLDPEVAPRFLRLELDSETFTFPELQTLMKLVYSPPFAQATVDHLKDCCGTSRGWTNTFLADNQARDLVRERYMRARLASELKDGDVIITHPVHMRHILNAERRPQGL